MINIILGTITIVAIVYAIGWALWFVDRTRDM